MERLAPVAMAVVTLLIWGVNRGLSRVLAMVPTRAAMVVEITQALNMAAIRGPATLVASKVPLTEALVMDGVKVDTAHMLEITATDSMPERRRERCTVVHTAETLGRTERLAPSTAQTREVTEEALVANVQVITLVEAVASAPVKITLGANVLVSTAARTTGAMLWVGPLVDMVMRARDTVTVPTEATIP
jgi:hypothetical protein